MRKNGSYLNFVAKTQNAKRLLLLKNMKKKKKIKSEAKTQNAKRLLLLKNMKKKKKLNLKLNRETRYALVL